MGIHSRIKNHRNPSDICFPYTQSLYVAGRTDGITWYENTDGLGTFGTAHHSIRIQDAYRVLALDVDGDDDIDVVTTGESAGIAWHENNGTGLAWSEHTLVAGIAYQGVVAADIDGFGVADLLSAEASGLSTIENVQWFRGNGTGFGAPQALPQNADTNRVYAVHAGDVDGDGKPDAVVSYVESFPSGQATVKWMRNLGGGSFANPVTIVATGELSIIDIFCILYSYS